LAAGAVPVQVDRVVVRFYAPETGGVSHPRYVLERELSFEARLEALSEGQTAEPYLDRHVRAALERHVAEDLLAHLAIDPEPSELELRERLVATRAVLEQRVGGKAALLGAARAEGMDDRELDTLVRREARASFYLDRMVTPMLEPSEAELREVHRSTTHPFRGQKFEQVVVALRRWYVGERLSSALGAFYQNARGRVHVVLLPQK